MIFHRAAPVAFLVPLILCSSLSAQTDQLSLQASGVAAVSNGATSPRNPFEFGVEGQLRLTEGAGSVGLGVRATSFERAEDEINDSLSWDASSLGFFVEPRFVVGVLGDRVSLYVLGRLASDRLSANESGFRSDGLGSSPVAYSVEGSLTSFAGYLGSGLLIRLTPHVNLDLGSVEGIPRWGHDRPPIVVPPTVLVQRPPEAWGEGR